MNISNQLKQCINNLKTNYFSLIHNIQDLNINVITELGYIKHLDLPCEMNDEQQEIYYLKYVLENLKSNYNYLYQYYNELYKECNYYFNQPNKLKNNEKNIKLTFISCQYLN